MLREHLKTIVILCLISSLARFVLDSYLPSLPAIDNYFSISDSQSQLTLTLYLLGFSVSQLAYGPLSDYYGRKPIILVGMLIFLLASITCALATSPALLLVSRLMTGIGAGACGVLSRAIASDCFNGKLFAKAWSYTTTALVLTLIIAPLIGGFVQDYIGWRGNFVVASLAVASVLIIILKFLPETNTKRLGVSLCARGIFKSYYSILRHRIFIACTLCYTIAFSGLIAYFQISPMLYINEFGLTPSQYGLTSLVIAASYLVGGLLVNQLTRFFSCYYLICIGVMLLIVGGMIMLISNLIYPGKLMAVLLPAAIYFVGARIVIPNAIADSMREFRHLGGSTSALIGCIQMLGSSLLSFILTYFVWQSQFTLALSLTILAVICLLITYWIKAEEAKKTEILPLLEISAT